MTWTYNLSALATSQMMQVRTLIQDTIESDPQLQDEQIAFVLSQYPSTTMPYYAAAAACDMIAFFYAREVQNSLGPISESAQQRYEHYVALAQSLRVLAATQGKGIIQGSIAGIRIGAPRLGGGGPSYLGTSAYQNPEGL